MKGNPAKASVRLLIMALSSPGAHPDALVWERKRVRRILDIERALLPLQREQIDIYLNVPPARVRVRGRPEHPDSFRL